MCEFSHLLQAGPKSGFDCQDVEDVSEFKANNRSQLSTQVELPASTLAHLPSGLFKMCIEKVMLRK